MEGGKYLGEERQVMVRELREQNGDNDLSYL